MYTVCVTWLSCIWIRNRKLFAHIYALAVHLYCTWNTFVFITAWESYMYTKYIQHPKLLSFYQRFASMCTLAILRSALDARRLTPANEIENVFRLYLIFIRAYHRLQLQTYLLHSPPFSWYDIIFLNYFLLFLQYG